MKLDNTLKELMKKNKKEHNIWVQIWLKVNNNNILICDNTPYRVYSVLSVAFLEKETIDIFHLGNNDYILVVGF